MQIDNPKVEVISEWPSIEATSACLLASPGNAKGCTIARGQTRACRRHGGARVALPAMLRPYDARVVG